MTHTGKRARAVSPRPGRPGPRGRGRPGLRCPPGSARPIPVTAPFPLGLGSADAVPPVPQQARPPRLRGGPCRGRAQRLSRLVVPRRDRRQRTARELGVGRALRQRHHPRQRDPADQPRHRGTGRRLDGGQLRAVELGSHGHRGAEPARGAKPGLRLQGARLRGRRRVGSAHDALPRLLPRHAGPAAQPLPGPVGRAVGARCRRSHRAAARTFRHAGRPVAVGG